MHFERQGVQTEGAWVQAWVIQGGGWRVDVKSSVQMMQLVGAFERLVFASQEELGIMTRWISVGSSCGEAVPSALEDSGTEGSGT